MMTSQVPTVSSVEGNHQKLDGGAMFGNVPRPVWEKWLSPDSRGRIELACRALLIECDGQRILCETGIGAFFDPKMAERFGVEDSQHQLLISLQELGLSDADIDYVILSHLHFDHAGGLLPTWNEIQKGGQRLLFPKAKYIVGREAFARAKSPHPRDKASFIPGMVELLESSGRLVVVEGTNVPKIFPDRLSFKYTDGHTPGHMHTVFKGNQRTIFFAGDLIPGTPWIHLPVTMGYDRYAEKLIDEKEEFYDIAVPGKWLCFYTHDQVVSASQITLEGGKYSASSTFGKLSRMPI